MLPTARCCLLPGAAYCQVLPTARCCLLPGAAYCPVLPTARCCLHRVQVIFSLHVFCLLCVCSFHCTGVLPLFTVRVLGIAHACVSVVFLAEENRRIQNVTVYLPNENSRTHGSLTRQSSSRSSSHNNRKRPTNVEMAASVSSTVL